ncbi:MAG: transposase [Thermoplasmatales archaeon]
MILPIIPENKEVELASDGTGLKTSNAGEYRQFKYGDQNAKRKKYLVVIITADVRKKKLQYLEHIQGEGQSEPKVAEKQIKEDSKKYKIKKFYGDSAYDTNNMFDIIQSVGAEAAIKIRKNAAPENINGFKRRRKERRGYKRLGYRKWAGYKKYGMRCVWT